MKSFRHIAAAALLTLGAFSAVTYTSCSKDACKDVVCNNGGTCSGGNCSCPVGFNGTSCTSKAIYGNWTGSDACGTNTYNVNLANNTSSVDSNSVLVTNPGGFGSTVIITGTLSADAKTVTFTNQDIGSSRVLTGHMNMTTNNAFTFDYTVTGPLDNATCNGTYTRQ